MLIPNYQPVIEPRYNALLPHLLFTRNATRVLHCTPLANAALLPSNPCLYFEIEKANKNYGVIYRNGILLYHQYFVIVVLL
jgi:hypothetical protein